MRGRIARDRWRILRGIPLLFSRGKMKKMPVTPKRGDFAKESFFFSSERLIEYDVAIKESIY